MQKFLEEDGIVSKVILDAGVGCVTMSFCIT